MTPTQGSILYSFPHQWIGKVKKKYNCFDIIFPRISYNALYKYSVINFPFDIQHFI